MIVDKYKEKNNELAIVQKANQLMIDDIGNNLEKTKKEFKELIEESDELFVDNVSLQKSDSALDEINSQADELPEAAISINDNISKSSLSSDWDSIVKVSKREIESHGINPDQLFLYDLLSLEENLAIQEILNRPMYERIPWDKWDYGFAFGSGLIGGGLDIFLGTPGLGLQEQLADKNSWIGGQMQRIHNLHPGDAPIDYQGTHFGGGFHRGLTTGHDLFRPLEGIRQFMDGEFGGFYWANGKKYFIESAVNQYGKIYQPMSLGEAVLAWIIHMFCDFFSSSSLPIPGTSFIYAMDNRQLRIFVEQDLYQSGINLRHLVLQTIPPTAIEVIIRSYIFFRYRKQTVDPDALMQKKTELLAVAHSVCAGFNIGKVIITEDPLLINIPQLVALSRTLFKLVVQEYSRNSSFSKALRNLKDLRTTQQEYEFLLDKELSTIILS